MDLDKVVELARRKIAGEISDEEAKAALELLGEAEGSGGPPASVPTDDGPALDAELDAALARLRDEGPSGG